jgi:dipeptidyl aminopeptidase/acylaminoacyl peptidase
MTFDDLIAFHRVSEPKASPDGRWIACVVTDVDKGENRSNSDIWLIPAMGGTPRRLTSAPRHDRHPSWSPDGKFLAFESNRDGDFQIYTIPADGGEAVRLTKLSTGATQPVWSPDGGRIAFVSSVFPEFSSQPYSEANKANQERLEGREKSKVKARVIDHLLYRHWDSWGDGRRQHLFTVTLGAGNAAGAIRDLTPGDRDAVPNSSTFTAGDEFAFSPDGAELTYTATPADPHSEAWDTNHDLWSVDVRTGARKQRTTNPAADGCPRYSPDGKWLAYRAQARTGFEADRWQLMLLNRETGATRSLTAGFDRSVDDLVWAGDSQSVVIEAQDRGQKLLWTVALGGGDPAKLTQVGTAAEPSAIPGGVVFTISTLSAPAEVSRVLFGGSSVEPVTSFNRSLLANLKISTPESFTATGAGGKQVQYWMVKPPDFDGSKKYPLVFWVHGGPQSAFTDSWSYRWNPQVWAAQGYVIALPNPRGSTGFGQTFTDEISHDWGGKVFEDLMGCLGEIETKSFVDTNRMAAAGGSYGGYMMNWFQGHTTKFKTLITHCGVYDFTSMYGSTEEVWFDEWEHGIPWENPEFDRWSPHRFAGKFNTPNLVIHNELDFRVPLNQGLNLFTTLQRRGVDSRLLIFPDEGHWVLKPQNSELWHKTIFEWLAKYLKQ